MNARDFAERALLGVLLTEPAHIGKLTDWLRPEDFFRPAHQLIYRELRDMVAEANHAAAGEGAPGEAERYAMTVYDRIQHSGELGAHSITAPALVTLIQTAPPPSIAQPEQYALMVVEASIRRGLARDGVHVAQVAESADLTHILDTVEKALGAVEHAQQRWEHLTRPRPPPARPRLATDTPTPRTERARATGRPRLVERPTADGLRQAEHELLGAALARPDLLDRLAGRVLPEDFADPLASASYRCALRVHADAAATGRRVDPVTVAWQQQRDQARHGAGLDPTTLLALSNTPTAADPMYSAEIVLRGSVARRTRAAAAAVQAAAQHPDLHPTELLRTAREAYESVTTIAARMTGHASPAAGLAALAAPAPIDTTLRQTTARTTVPAPRGHQPRQHTGIAHEQS